MIENSTIIALLKEIIFRLEQQDDHERRISQLETHRGIESRPIRTEPLGPSIQTMPEQRTSPKLSQLAKANIKYFNHLIENEDGEVYVSVKDIHEEPDNYEIIINGNEADVRFSSDSEKIREMMSKYVDFFQPCKKINNPSNGCGVETVQPGHFKIEGERWYMESKITIKFT